MSENIGINKFPEKFLEELEEKFKSDAMWG
jgi:hypothetical protein